ncbi:hypothetical protein [Polaromonas sp. CG_9.11]|uniref:hypothetical protein n=1 Tax=Polaromonas sp. CG_9.11 TaxID=2787730 RepID=UPI0018CBC2AA|nr:hypothetical protein [Polaromonas sp. CG_9.11]MBG6075416.1 hypothetical protein [Polaromonas sp. CG_9.11]
MVHSFNDPSLHNPSLHNPSVCDAAPRTKILAWLLWFNPARLHSTLACIRSTQLGENRLAAQAHRAGSWGWIWDAEFVGKLNSNTMESAQAKGMINFTTPAGSVGMMRLSSRSDGHP